MYQSEHIVDYVMCNYPFVHHKQNRTPTPTPIPHPHPTPPHPLSSRHTTVARTDPTVDLNTVDAVGRHQARKWSDRDV